MTSVKELVLEIRENTAFLTFNRPAVNALTASMLESLASTLKGLESDRNVRCAVIRGSGDKAFSVGMDLSAMVEGSPEENQGLIGPGGPLRRALDAIEGCPFPVIAMIRGYALGAACELAVACDLRVGSENCQVGMPPARLGIVYPADGLRRFLERVGPSTTIKLFLTGERFEAGEAMRMGMLDFALPDERLEEFTMELAGTLAGNAPLSIKGHKRALRLLSKRAPLSEADEAELDSMSSEAMRSADAEEGLAAFFEKRDPDFKGE